MLDRFSILCRALYPKVRARVREYAPNAIVLLSAIMIGIVGSMTSAGYAPREFVSYAAFFWALCAALLIWSAHRHAVRVCQIFGDEVRAFVYVPTPIGSLIESLNSQDVATSELSKITLMASDLGESTEYYEKGDVEGVSLVQILNENPDLTVTAYGPLRAQNVQSPHKRMSLVVTPLQRTEHTNLIVTKNDKGYVWYEPYHNVVKGKHYFTMGAYLVDIDNEMKDKISQGYARLLSPVGSGTIDAGVLSTYAGASESAPVGTSLAPEKGEVMRAPELDESEDAAFRAFKVGLALMCIGFGAWLILLAWNKIAFALGASMIAAIGAHILMLVIVGGDRDKETGSRGKKTDTLRQS